MRAILEKSWRSLIPVSEPLPDPQELRQLIKLKKAPNLSEFPSSGVYTLDTLTVRLLWSELSRNLPDGMKQQLKEIVKDDPVKPCRQLKKCKGEGAYCYCHRSFASPFPDLSKAWKKLDQASVLAILQAAGSATTQWSKDLAQWDHVKKLLSDSPNGNAVKTAVKAVHSEHEGKIHACNAFAALISPSTYLEAVLAGSGTEATRGLMSSQGAAYLDKTGKMKDIILIIEDEKKHLASHKNKLPAKIYADLKSTYDMLTEKRGLSPLQLASERVKVQS